MKKINYKKIAGIVTSFCLTFLLPIFVTHALPGCDPSTITNPLGCNNNSVEAILLKIMDIVALIGGIVVAFFIIFSGFKFVMARGNEGELTKAKNMFYATVIGGAILLGASIIANIVVTTVETIKKTP